MAWVITRLCRDCVDQACVDVCPVECIYAYTGDDASKFPNQLYIHPEECIDCGACEPECPWEAIFEDASVPEVFSADTAHNGLAVSQSPGRNPATGTVSQRERTRRAEPGTAGQYIAV